MLKHPPTSSSDSAGQAGPLACDRQRRLEAAAEVVVRRLETGERMDVALLALEYPDLMPELGQRLHDLRRLRRAEEQARLRSGQMPPHDPRQAFLAEELETLRQALDAYEVLERVQYGGQGVVYRARQRSTNRIAALKLLLDGPLASERARHRFEREIELVSRLRHPNIITVYESGVVRGRHYYAMEFVAGLAIDDYVILHDLPPRGIVPLIVKVCRAVHHAHQNGVIHRDLNPANILVDEQGEPRVYDFGLAKDLWADRAEAGVSFTGAGAGTLPYLSPEQAGGQDGHVDVRSDVYSIGLVLYELLTDMLPYPVRGDAAAVQAAILHTEPMPLRRAVALGGRERATGLDTINGDLERILAKALSKAKEERYQTAADFADDLERFLGGDAVVARADSRLYILRKALRRHRLAVGIAATILAALAVSSVTVTVAWLRVRQGRDRAREAARVAYDLFDMALTDVEESVQPLAGGVAVRDRLIQRLSGKMPQLEALTGSDTALDPVLTRLLEKQGDIAAQQGQREAAKHYYGAFLDNSLRRAASATPDESEQCGVIRAYRKLAELSATPIPVYESGCRFAEPLVQSTTGDERARYELSKLLLSYGSYLYDGGMPERALPFFDRVRALAPSATADEPVDTAWEYAVAEAQSGRSLILRKLGQGDEARAAAENALARRERLLAQNPADTQARSAVLSSYVHLGTMRRDTGALDESKGYLTKAAEQAEFLAALDPTMTSLDSERYGIHDRLAVLCLDLGQLDEAERYGEKAIAIAQSWAAREHTPDTQSRLGYAVNLKGRIQMQRGQFVEAKTSFEQALAIYSALHEQTPDQPVRKTELAATHSWLSAAIGKLGDKTLSIEHQERALELQEQLAQQQANVVEHAVELARARLNLASAYGDLRTAAGNARAMPLLQAAERSLRDLQAAGKLVGWERDCKVLLEAIAAGQQIIARRQAKESNPTPKADESQTQTPTTGPS